MKSATSLAHVAQYELHHTFLSSFFFLLFLLLFGGVGHEKIFLPVHAAITLLKVFSHLLRETPLLIHPELLLTRLQPPLTSWTVWVAVNLPVLP